MASQMAQQIEAERQRYATLERDKEKKKKEEEERKQAAIQKKREEKERKAEERRKHAEEAKKAKEAKLKASNSDLQSTNGEHTEAPKTPALDRKKSVSFKDLSVTAAEERDARISEKNGLIEGERKDNNGVTNGHALSAEEEKEIIELEKKEKRRQMIENAKRRKAEAEARIEAEKREKREGKA